MYSTDYTTFCTCNTKCNTKVLRYCIDLSTYIRTSEGSSPAGPGNFRFSGTDALAMGVVTPLPIGVDTSGVVCLALVGVCIVVSAIIALCGVVSLAFDRELLGVHIVGEGWGVESMPPYILLARPLDNVGVLGKPMEPLLLD
jgi:hypothetical protein